MTVYPLSKWERWINRGIGCAIVAMGILVAVFGVDW